MMDGVNLLRKKIVILVFLFSLLIILVGCFNVVYTAEFKEKDNNDPPISSESSESPGIGQNEIGADDFAGNTFLTDLKFTFDDCSDLGSSFKHASTISFPAAENLPGNKNLATLELCKKFNDDRGDITEREVVANTYVKDIEINLENDGCDSGWREMSKIQIKLIGSGNPTPIHDEDYVLCLGYNSDGSGSGTYPPNSITEYEIAANTYFRNVRITNEECEDLDLNELSTFTIGDVDYVKPLLGSPVVDIGGSGEILYICVEFNGKDTGVEARTVPAPGAIRLFEEKNYAGSYEDVSESLSELGDFDNKASSVKLGNNVDSITLYEHVDSRGAALVITKDIPDLEVASTDGSLDSFNDVTSSIDLGDTYNNCIERPELTANEISQAPGSGSADAYCAQFQDKSCRNLECEGVRYGDCGDFSLLDIFSGVQEYGCGDKIDEGDGGLYSFECCAAPSETTPFDFGVQCFEEIQRKLEAGSEEDMYTKDDIKNICYSGKGGCEDQDRFTSEQVVDCKRGVDSKIGECIDVDVTAARLGKSPTEYCNALDYDENSIGDRRSCREFQCSGRSIGDSLRCGINTYNCDYEFSGTEQADLSFECCLAPSEDPVSYGEECVMVASEELELDPQEISSECNKECAIKFEGDDEAIAKCSAAVDEAIEKPGTGGRVSVGPEVSRTGLVKECKEFGEENNVPATFCFGCCKSQLHGAPEGCCELGECKSRPSELINNVLCNDGSLRCAVIIEFVDNDNFIIWVDLVDDPDTGIRTGIPVDGSKVSGSDIVIFDYYRLDGSGLPQKYSFNAPLGASCSFFSSGAGIPRPTETGTTAGAIPFSTIDNEGILATCGPNQLISGVHIKGITEPKSLSDTGDFIVTCSPVVATCEEGKCVE